MFGAPPCLQITDRAWFEATPTVLRRPFLMFRARSAHFFPLLDPALPFSAIAKMCPVLAREAQNCHLSFFFYVPGVLWSFRCAPNHVPVQPTISRNAQVHGLKHPPTSQMRQVRALKPIESTFSDFWCVSCEDCSHLCIALGSLISHMEVENVTTPHTRDKK